MVTFIARWYVAYGKADIGLVSEENEELAYQVVRSRLEQAGVKFTKIRLRRFEPKHGQFMLLSDGGWV